MCLITTNFERNWIWMVTYTLPGKYQNTRALPLGNQSRFGIPQFSIAESCTFIPFTRKVFFMDVKTFFRESFLDYLRGI